MEPINQEIKINVDPNALKQKGNDALKAEKYDQAISLYQEALKVSQNYSKYLFKTTEEQNQLLSVLNLNLAVCYFHKNELDKSLNLCDQALEYNPTYLKAHYRKALIFEKVNKLAEAFELVKKLLTIEKSNPDCLKLKESLEKRIRESIEERIDMYKLIMKRINECKSEKDFSLLYSELKMNISSPQDVKPLYDKDLLVQLLEVAKASGTKEALQSEDNQRRVLFILEISNFLLRILFSKAYDAVSKANLSNKTQNEKLEINLRPNHNEILLELSSLILMNYEDVGPVMQDKLLLKIVGLMRFVILQNDLVATTKFIALLIKRLDNDFMDKDFIGISLSYLSDSILFSLHYWDATKNKGQDVKEGVVNLNEIFSVFLELKSVYAERDQMKDKLHNFGGSVAKLVLHLLENSNESLDGVISRLFQDLKAAKLEAHKNRVLQYLFYLLVAKPATVVQSLTKENLLKDLIGVINYYSEDSKRLLCDEAKLSLKIFGFCIREADFFKQLIEKEINILQMLTKFLQQKSFEINLIVMTIILRLLAKDASKESSQMIRDLFNRQFLHEMAEYTNMNLIRDMSEAKEVVDLFVYLTFVDYFKIFIIKSNFTFRILGKLCEYIQKLPNVHEKFLLALGIVEIVKNLTRDQNKERMQSHREKYGMNEEEFENFRQLNNFIENNGKSAEDQGFVLGSYTTAFIEENRVKKHSCYMGRVHEFLSVFLQHPAPETFSDSIKRSISDCLLTLSEEKENITLLVRKDIIKIVLLCNQHTNADDIKATTEKILAKLFASTNPNLLNYEQSIIATDILCKGVRRADHELSIFEATLALTQLTSLGEHVCKRIMEANGLWENIAFNLGEENQFIVHSSLELLNNMAIQEDTQNFFQKYSWKGRDIKIFNLLYIGYLEDLIYGNYDKEDALQLAGKFNSLLGRLSLVLGLFLFLNISYQDLIATGVEKIAYRSFETLVDKLSELIKKERYCREDVIGHAADMMYKTVSIALLNKENKELDFTGFMNKAAVFSKTLGSLKQLDSNSKQKLDALKDFLPKVK